MHVAVNTRSGTNGPSLVTRSCYDSALIRGLLVPKPKFFGCHINRLIRYREGFSDTN